jgi:hypothetical protein
LRLGDARKCGHSHGLGRAALAARTATFARRASFIAATTTALTTASTTTAYIINKVILFS